MTTDKQAPSTEAFEAWHHDKYKWCDMEDELCVTRYETWQASRQQALEEAADMCLNDAISYKKLTMNKLLTANGKTLHEGMYGGAYNCAIALKDLK